MTTGKIHGMATKEPAFGTPAVWIDAGSREQAEMYGYTVVEPGSVIATHLTETVRKKRRRNTHPRRHKTPHRRIETHLARRGRRTDTRRNEAGRSAADPANAAPRSGAHPPVGPDSGGPRAITPRGQKTRILLTEYVRHRLARTICTRYRDKERCLYVITLDPALEDRIRSGFDHNEHGMFIRMSPQAVEAICRMISAELEKLVTAGHPPVVLVSPQIRAVLKQMTAPHIPQLDGARVTTKSRATRRSIPWPWLARGIKCEKSATVVAQDEKATVQPRTLVGAQISDKRILPMKKHILQVAIVISTSTAAFYWVCTSITARKIRKRKSSISQRTPFIPQDNSTHRF